MDEIRDWGYTKGSMKLPDLGLSPDADAPSAMPDYGLSPPTVAGLIATLGDPPDRAVEAAARHFHQLRTEDVLGLWDEMVKRDRDQHVSTMRSVLAAALAEWGDESEDTDD